ncbi:MAG: M20/M25/M40 family metallo-hydrolase [Acidobacteria bacterium]|nr:M20/M25/M40 family metallo-hydrolase [Acidobacteriota bacterium]MBI3657759.1 M20/M25/M40 family metallo-hydrolase [Acidobacteriota bacterium]
MSVFELTRQLMAIPSFTEEEGSLAAFLSDLLSTRGYTMTPIAVSERRYNVVARLDRPVVLLCTHMDTVPPFIPFREDDLFIYGRGACDAKGIIAAMITAGDVLMSEGIKNFGFLFTVGEETDSLGARVAGLSDLRADYIVVGEPTENRLAVSHKGNVMFTLSAAGRAAHSAYPESGESAIDKLLDVLTDLRRADFGTDSLLGPATLNIGVIAGGVRANVIPDAAEAKVLIRAVTPARQVMEQVITLCQGRAEVAFVNQVDPQRMVTLPGYETTRVSFGTDIPYLRSVGQPLLIGPGSILTAHGPEERVAKQELLRAVELYVALVKDLCR